MLHEWWYKCINALICIFKVALINFLRYKNTAVLSHFHRHFFQLREWSSVGGKVKVVARIKHNSNPNIKCVSHFINSTLIQQNKLKMLSSLTSLAFFSHPDQTQWFGFVIEITHLYQTIFAFNEKPLHKNTKYKIHLVWWKIYWKVDIVKYLLGKARNIILIHHSSHVWKCKWPNNLYILLQLFFLGFVIIKFQIRFWLNIKLLCIH